jgi:putative redox protein
MDATVKWDHGFTFSGAANSGFIVPLGAKKEGGGEGDGFTPLELVLVGLAGCTAMDVISILEKKRQDVTGFEVKAHADRAADHPRVFTDITVEYIVRGRNINPEAVDRAIELSETKYCSASAMLRMAANIRHTVQIIEEAEPVTVSV